MKKILAGLMLMLFIAAGCAAQADTGRRADQPEISGVVLDVHREGGLAGVCEDITIMATGEVEITDCDGTSLMAEPGSTLDDAQLATLLDWASTYTSAEADFNDEVPADGLANHLTFNGVGDVLPGTAVQEEMLAFAGEVYAQHADLNAGM